MKSLSLHTINMKQMDVQSVKIDLIHWLTELQDMSIIEKLQGLKEQQQSNAYKLSEEHKNELDRRLEKYENGKMNFSSWDTVKNRIRNHVKNDL